MILDNKGISQKKFFLPAIGAGYMQELFYSYLRLVFFEGLSALCRFFRRAASSAFSSPLTQPYQD